MLWFVLQTSIGSLDEYYIFVQYFAKSAKVYSFFTNTLDNYIFQLIRN